MALWQYEAWPIDGLTFTISLRLTVTGNAKIMTYDDIVGAEQKRTAKEAPAPGTKRRGCRCLQSSKPGGGNLSRADELELGKRETEAIGLVEHCSVLQF